MATRGRKILYGCPFPENTEQLDAKVLTGNQKLARKNGFFIFISDFWSELLYKYGVLSHRLELFPHRLELFSHRLELFSHRFCKIEFSKF